MGKKFDYDFMLVVFVYFVVVVMICIHLFSKNDQVVQEEKVISIEMESDQEESFDISDLACGAELVLSAPCKNEFESVQYYSPEQIPDNLSVIETDVLHQSMEVEEEIDSLEIDLFSEDFLNLVATIHLEAGPAATIESKMAVGNVVKNRLFDIDSWGYSTWSEVILDDDQFAVTDLADFRNVKQTVVSGNWDDNLEQSVLVAQLIMLGSDLYEIPEDVQFFYGDPDKRTWGKHIYCFTVGGNSFFK